MNFVVRSVLVIILPVILFSQTKPVSIERYRGKVVSATAVANDDKYRFYLVESPSKRWRLLTVEEEAPSGEVQRWPEMEFDLTRIE